MSDYGRISKSIVKAIADALRFCNGNEAQYTPGQMPNAVRLLKKRLTQKTITRNGVYIPPSNYDGFDRVTVNVEGGETVLVEKSITANGNYNPADDLAGGYSGVSVNVQIPPAPTLVSKNITANGDYNPSDDSADGYSFVSVAIPGPSLQSKTATANGTVTPDSGYDGMSSVEVAVPNTYSAADNGKVVSGGQLVAQTARAAAITQNGTFDTTENNSVTVNVQGGGSSVLEPVTITQNGVYTPRTGVDGYNSVTVNVSGGGTAEAPYNDVIFIDCYGAIVYSYTAAQFSELSAMPENPSRDGLTAQGWNWTLSDAKAYVAKYGKLVIGQMYITYDGKTRIYIRLDKSRLAPYLGLAVNGTATIDWGDGNQSTVTGTSVDAVIKTQHVYASQGEYTITIDVNGSAKIVGDSNLRLSTLITKNSAVTNENRCYLNTVQKVEIGRNVDIGNYAFYGCYSISSLAMPRGITGIGEYAICTCYGLHGFTIPSGITTIGNYAFSACCGMEHISIPNDVESIGNYSFNINYNLANVTLPESVETIGDNAFFYCYSLSKIRIPDNVVTIGSNAFFNCYSIVSVLIPSNVTSIGAIAFKNCYGIAEIHFRALTPPTIGSSEAFAGVPTDCKIYVPTGTLSAYTSALYYPDPATYTYIEE